VRKARSSGWYGPCGLTACCWMDDSNADSTPSAMMRSCSSSGSVISGSASRADSFDIKPVPKRCPSPIIRLFTSEPAAEYAT
jgi:hypothetical protein